MKGWRLLVEMEHPVEAAALRARLEQMGIDTMMEHEGMQALIPVGKPFAARIYVRKTDHARALAVLAQWRAEEGKEEG